MAKLRAMDADVERALEQINVPAYVIDTHGIIRWVNPAGKRVVGDVTGRQFTSVVAPEETRRARESFAQKIVGNVEATDEEVVLVQDDGDRINVEVSAVPLYSGDKIIGVFGQVVHLDEEPDRAAASEPDPATVRGAEAARARPFDGADLGRAAPQPRDGAQPHPPPVPGARRPFADRSRRRRAARLPGDQLRAGRAAAVRAELAAAGGALAPAAAWEQAPLPKAHAAHHQADADRQEQRRQVGARRAHVAEVGVPYSLGGARPITSTASSSSTVIASSTISTVSEGLFQRRKIAAGSRIGADPQGPLVGGDPVAERRRRDSGLALHPFGAGAEPAADRDRALVGAGQPRAGGDEQRHPATIRKPRRR